MKYYAMSDIHGNVKAFEEALVLIDLNNLNNKLVLLGDYVHGGDSVAVIDRVMALEEKYGKDRVVVLRGNHTVDDYLLGTPDDWFTNMYPPNTGKFVTDVIAGHTGTHKISGNPDFHDIYYDGESHFYALIQ